MFIVDNYCQPVVVYTSIGETESSPTFIKLYFEVALAQRFFSYGLLLIACDTVLSAANALSFVTVLSAVTPEVTTYV